MGAMIDSGSKFLDYLNATYSKSHKAYEDAFWLSYMGDHSVDKRMNEAQAARDAFRADSDLKAKTAALMSKSKGEIKRRLKLWLNFFSLYQTPPEALPIRKKIAKLEAAMLKMHTDRKEGYTDPKTKKFVEASENRMRVTMRTHPDEKVRKACFDAMEKLPLETLDKYIEAVRLRNEFARTLGYSDFYEYKARIDENMSKKELFSIFEKIYDKTKYAFKDVRGLEKDFEKKGKSGLRKPWNFGYMISGNFTKEEDPYFRFENVLSYWGRTMSALGLGFKGGTVTLDLLDRKGKHSNGFCHYPVMVGYKDGRRIPGTSNFASNAIPDQVGSGIQGIHTVFHEGGHAADRLNSTQADACINSEYPPSTVSWAETHSMFMDTISSSIEWKTRYAKNEEGEPYPFDIFERKLRATHLLRPLDLMGIMMIVFFEKEIYECKHLTRAFVLNTAKKMYRKFTDYSVDSLRILNTPHIYSWESSAYYHGYGLAQLGVAQWRNYFFKRFGYIVDNHKVGKEITKIWSYASLYPAKKLIKMATGKPLSPDAYIKGVTRPLEDILTSAHKKIARLKKVPMHSRPIDLNGRIVMVHGKKKIADNSKSFEDMDKRYRRWLRAQSKTKREV